MHSKQEISVFLKRKMRFWDPLGSTQEFSIQTFIKVMKHPKFLLFGGLTLLFFFATDPSTNRPYVPLWASADADILIGICDPFSDDLLLRKRIAEHHERWNLSVHT